MGVHWKQTALSKELFDPKSWTEFTLINQNRSYFKSSELFGAKISLCFTMLPNMVVLIFHTLSQPVLTQNNLQQDLVSSKRNPFHRLPWRPAGWTGSNHTMDAYSLKSLGSLKLHYFDLVLTRKSIKPQWNNVIFSNQMWLRLTWTQ